MSYISKLSNNSYEIKIATLEQRVIYLEGNVVKKRNLNQNVEVEMMKLRRDMSALRMENHTLKLKSKDDDNKISELKEQITMMEQEKEMLEDISDVATKTTPVPSDKLEDFAENCILTYGRTMNSGKQTINITHLPMNIRAKLRLHIKKYYFKFIHFFTSEQFNIKKYRGSGNNKTLQNKCVVDGCNKPITTNSEKRLTIGNYSPPYNYCEECVKRIKHYKY